MRRREFIKLVCGSAAAWPFMVRAQQAALPVVGFVDLGAADASVARATAFRKGLSETGYIEGQNVTVEYHWLEGRYESAPAVMADLVRRQVAVITTTVAATALAAKAATPVMTLSSLVSSRALRGPTVT
jgi:putative ABC transport system substrate-binding protein